MISANAVSAPFIQALSWAAANGSYAAEGHGSPWLLAGSVLAMFAGSVIGVVRGTPMPALEGMALPCALSFAPYWVLLWFSNDFQVEYVVFVAVWLLSYLIRVGAQGALMCVGLPLFGLFTFWAWLVMTALRKLGILKRKPDVQT